MTRTPVMFSRSTTFMRSMKPCSFSKMPAAFHTMIAARISTKITTASMTQPICTSSENDSATPITQMIGTGSRICMPIISACWMTLTSLSVRVIIEPVPNSLKSPSENVSEES